jgi:hypothetical protein
MAPREVVQEVPEITRDQVLRDLVDVAAAERAGAPEAVVRTSGPSHRSSTATVRR